MDAPQKKALSLSGMFYRRRDDWIRYVIKRPKDELSHVERLVAVYIAEAINPKTRVWVVSQERIALDLEIGVRIVKSAVAKLRARGLIRTERVRVAGHSKLFNAYSLVAIEEAVPEPEVHGGARA